MKKKDNSILDSIGESGLTPKERTDRQRKQKKSSGIAGMIPYLREAQQVFRMIDNIISV